MALTTQQTTSRAQHLIDHLRERNDALDVPSILAAALTLVVEGQGGDEDDAHVLVSYWANLFTPR